MPLSHHTCFVIFGLLAAGLAGCADGAKAPPDPGLMARGEALFRSQCAGCHNFSSDGIGPNLTGVTAATSPDWVKRFVQSPEGMIRSGDHRAVSLHNQYKVMMPSFSALAEKELDAVVAYVHHYKPADSLIAGNKPLQNPIPQPIQSSGITLTLQPVAQLPASGTGKEPPVTRITKLDVMRGSADLFVLEMRGTLYRIRGGKPQVYFDLAAQVPHFLQAPGLGSGFGSFAFHPDFSSNGLLYTVHTEEAGAALAHFRLPAGIKAVVQGVVTEWKTATPLAKTFEGTRRELMRFDMPNVIHGVQEISFNPTARRGSADYGLLYIAVGDGGSAEQGAYYLLGTAKSGLGAVLRIDPAGRNSANGRYGIPFDNPFAAAPDGRLPEVFAYGFRNPHRMSWSLDGKLWVSNVGQANSESVYLVKAGQNYGWPHREGSFCLYPERDLNKVYPLPANDKNFGYAYPVAQYDHGEGKAISGGYVYQGALAQLKDAFVFGDIVNGRVFLFRLADTAQRPFAPVQEVALQLAGKPGTLTAFSGSQRVDLHFGQDGAGELYLLTKADGRMYKVVAATKEQQ